MITPLLSERCELGENPLWNADAGCLYWTDITGGRLHRFHLVTGEHAVIYRGEQVGGFTLQADGALLLFRTKDLALLRPDGGIEVLQRFADAGAARFNDVIADPEGRVFAGTIGVNETSGGLYRVDHGGTITLLCRGTGVSNGMGFSPDLRTFYWTCSTRRRIQAFDFDRETGALSGERLFYQATPAEGIPDGMTVDRDGHVWSARWDGFAVVRHAPDGGVLARHPVPAAKVSSVCFGGAELDEMFITTARGESENSSAAGQVFRWRPGARGRAEFRSRIAAG